MVAYTKALASEAEFAQQAQEDVLLMPSPPMATPAAPGLSCRRVVAAGAFLFVCMLAGGASGNSLRAGSSRSAGAAIKLPEEELIKHLNAITDLENTPETAPTTTTPVEQKKPNAKQPDGKETKSPDPTETTGAKNPKTPRAETNQTKGTKPATTQPDGKETKKGPKPATTQPDGNETKSPDPTETTEAKNPKTPRAETNQPNGPNGKETKSPDPTERTKVKNPKPAETNQANGPKPATTTTSPGPTR